MALTDDEELDELRGADDDEELDELEEGEALDELDVVEGLDDDLPTSWSSFADDEEELDDDDEELDDEDDELDDEELDAPAFGGLS